VTEHQDARGGLAGAPRASPEGEALPGDLPAGTLVGEYRIERLVGRGGMGAVYLAAQPEIGAQVAIKVLAAQHSRDPGLLRRFVDEARAVNKIRHPNIVDIFAFGRLPDGRQYLIMEYLEGESLSACLARGDLPASEARLLLAQIVAALHAAHAERIVHRDLKPDNVWIVQPKHGEPFAKILDFGIAKLLEGHDAALITESGMTLGTAHYMSPEQCRAEAVDHRADIYSLGVILYEIFAGRRPFGGGGFTAVVAQQMTATPAPPSSHRALPEALEELILRCLEKDPALRPQSVRALGDELEDALAEPSPRETRPPRPAMLPTEPARATEKGRKQIVAGGLLALAGLAGLALAFAFYRATARGPAAPAGSMTALAVLPLANLSHDPEQEYFADGMTDALITDLSRIRSLRVVSRTSVMAYKGTSKSLQEIARELKVDGVLEGSVVRAGDRIRITAHLVRASDDRQMWSESYERELRDILVLQGAVASDVVGQIKAQITAEEHGQLTNRRVTKPAAYLAYVRGRYFWNQRNEKSLKTAIGYFEEAIREDPSFAPAHSGVADAHFYLGYFFGHDPPREAMPKAKAAALEALALDGSLGEAHASLAMVKFAYDWDWPGAEQEFRRAIELEPNYATAHHVYAAFLGSMRRMDEAVAEARRALALDPLSLPVNNFLGEILTYAGRYDEALAQLGRTLELDPSFSVAQESLGYAYELMGREPLAVAQLLKAKALGGESPALIEALRRAFERDGVRGFRSKELEQTMLEWDGWHVTAMAISSLHAKLGHSEEALTWLEKAFEARSSALVLLDMGYPEIGRALGSDPRYQDLRRRIGLR
jgi:TolB-like protein/tetratricopeptide (TPR) repeat protein